MSKKNPPQRGAIVLDFLNRRPGKFRFILPSINALLYWYSARCGRKISRKKRGGSLSSLIVRRWLMFLLCSSCSTPPVGLYQLWALFFSQIYFSSLTQCGSFLACCKDGRCFASLRCSCFDFPAAAIVHMQPGPRLLCVAGSSLS